MPLGGEARFLSNNLLAQGLLENFPNRLQFLTVLPFFGIKGNSLTYVRTPELTFADTIGFCDRIPEHTKLPERPVDFPMAELATHFEVCYKSQDIFSDTNDQVAVQQGLAIRQLLYRFGEQFEIGNTQNNPNTFKGLKQLVNPSKVIDLGGAPLTIEHLDQAKGLVRTNNGYAGVIITNQLGYEFIRKAHYNVGIIPETAEIAVPDPLNGMRMQKVTSFDGFIVYINDKQPVMRQSRTNIWFAILGWNHLHAIIPESVGENMFVSRTTIRPDSSQIVTHVTWPVGLALGSQSALAGILNAAEPEKHCRKHKKHCEGKDNEDK